MDVMALSGTAMFAIVDRPAVRGCLLQRRELQLTNRQFNKSHAIRRMMRSLSVSRRVCEVQEYGDMAAGAGSDAKVLGRE